MSAVALSSKPRPRNMCTLSAQTVHLGVDLRNAIKAAWPTKTWGRIADFFNLSERAAKYRLSGERPFTVEEIAILLRTEHGIEILAALMGNAEPRWWRAVKVALGVADARRALQKHKRQLQEAINEYEGLGATCALGETALSVQDEEFYRPHLSALGEARRSMVRKT